MAIRAPGGAKNGHCIVLHSIAWYCMVLLGNALYCMVLQVLYGLTQYCMVLPSIAWYCMIMHGTTWYSMVLHGLADQNVFNFFGIGLNKKGSKWEKLDVGKAGYFGARSRKSWK